MHTMTTQQMLEKLPTVRRGFEPVSCINDACLQEHNVSLYFHTSLAVADKATVPSFQDIQGTKHSLSVAAGGQVRAHGGGV